MGGVVKKIDNKNFMPLKITWYRLVSDDVYYPLWVKIDDYKEDSLSIGEKIMKTTIKKTGNFEPIDVTFHIESREELITLWHKLCTSKSNIEDRYFEEGNVSRDDIVFIDDYEAWGVIDGYCNENGIDPWEKSES